MASDGTEVRVAMTPEKRAREVRNKLRDECLRLDNPGLVGGCGCSWCHAIESLLPPGSIIIIPDEAKELRLCIRAGIFGIPEGEVRRLCAMLGGGS